MSTRLKRLRSVATNKIRGQLGLGQWAGGVQPVT